MEDQWVKDAKKILLRIILIEYPITNAILLLILNTEDAYFFISST